MVEKPVTPAPKSSETDPPEANQPRDASETRQVVPGKPDGEVDTRPN